MIIVYILIGLIIGSLGLYLILRNKLKVTQEYNLEIQKENEIQSAQYTKLLASNAKLSQENQTLEIKKQEIKNSLVDLKETQTKAAENFYAQALEIAQNSFEKEIEKISNNLEQNREEAQEEYATLLKDAVADFESAIEEKQKEFSYWNRRIIALQQDVQVALEAAKRKQELENRQDFYRICLSDEDISEIKRLREVLPYLRDKTPLNKVIYKIYYERPLTDMIGRVVGPEVRTGIYKITNIENQMCYVGQAVNIAERWKQHCKRGVGAEDWTQNKLYPAMYSFGVENFTFEIIEDCDRANLNEREDYWQLYFHAKDFGYSIK